MQPVLVDCGQLVGESLVEKFDDLKKLRNITDGKKSVPLEDIAYLLNGYGRMVKYISTEVMGSEHLIVQEV